MAMKDAYRTAMSLLTSKEIREIRETYGITQKDLCVLLGWGEKTITRYESYQVQDKAHDTILKKLAQDPEWFIQLLAASQNLISEENYKKYQEKAMNLYDSNRDIYLKKAIQGKYHSLSKDELEIWNTVIEKLCKMTTSNVVDVVDFMHREKAYQETLM